MFDDSIRAEPLVGWMHPARSLNVVDFPLPLTPNNLRRTTDDTFLTTTTTTTVLAKKQGIDDII